MSLLTYEEARPWAKAIRDEVLARRMPPWGAVKGVGEFRDDPSLSQPEMDMLVAWVEGGAPEGEPIYLPPPSMMVRPPPAAIPHGREILITAAAPSTLDQAVDLLALRPEKLADGGSLELTAWLPDGEVRHLIWLREYRSAWSRTYILRDPMRLPRGTRLALFSGDPVAAATLIASPAP
jgi:hypothetical protein